MRTLLAKIWRALKLPRNIQLSVMRLFQAKFLIGVTGIIFNDQGKVLLFKHRYRAHSWSLPGGYLSSGEHPREGLEREIKEESGLIVSVDQQLKTRTDRDNAVLDMCYTGVFIGGEFTPSYEVSEYGFFALDQMPLLRSNQVVLINSAINERKNLQGLTT